MSEDVTIGVRANGWRLLVEPPPPQASSKEVLPEVPPVLDGEKLPDPTPVSRGFLIRMRGHGAFIVEDVGPEHAPEPAVFQPYASAERWVSTRGGLGGSENWEIVPEPHYWAAVFLSLSAPSYNLFLTFRRATAAIAQADAAGVGWRIVPCQGSSYASAMREIQARVSRWMQDGVWDEGTLGGGDLRQNEDPEPSALEFPPEGTVVTLPTPTIADVQAFVDTWLSERAGVTHDVLHGTRFGDHPPPAALTTEYRLQRQGVSIWLGIVLHPGPDPSRRHTMVRLRVDRAGYQSLDDTVRVAALLSEMTVDARELQTILDAMPILPPDETPPG